MSQKNRHLIPPLIKDAINNNTYNGYIYAGVLFIDIKGFTKITSYLQKYSKEGAEIISDIINDIFSPSVKFVYENNGFISSFAGDAFTALFPNNIKGMLNASILIKNKLSNFQVKTKYGNFIIKTKISLSYGKVKFKILKNKLNTFYFYSDSIKQASTIKHNKHNRILMHKSVIKNANTYNIIIKKITNNIFELIEYNMKTDIKKKKYAIRKSIEKQFIIKDIYTINTGEFRDIVSLFINIYDINHIEEVNNIIFENIEKYGAYYNKIDYGDKGIVILLLFGAPISQEGQLYNAVNFSIKLRNEFYKRTNSKKIKIGLSSGIAYTGFIGSNIQSEYTAIGKSVNLSARLMSNAKYNHIYSDKREVFNIYECKEIGKIKIKGFSTLIKVYDVLDKKNKKILNNTFINRKNEIEYIKNIINKNKIIFVLGNAGIGKTTLIEHFLNSNGFDYFAFNKNNYSNETFSVFRQIFKDYFLQSNYKKQLKNYLNNNKELIKFKDYYEYLLGIKSREYFSNISNKIFNDNIGYALSIFIKKLFERKKTILFFDDVHLLDINSFEIIQNILSKRIKIILSGRNEIKENIQNNLYEKIIIKGLNKQNTKKIIKHILNHNVHSDIINYIYGISKGNPLIIEKSIKYLKEKNL